MSYLHWVCKDVAFIIVLIFSLLFSYYILKNKDVLITEIAATGDGSVFI